jgi:ribosomal protein S18 acetylase RimI-like enzyme
MSVEPNSGTAAAGPTWDHRSCTGTEGCPPRCPRFVDKKGASLLVRPYAGRAYEALVDFYDEYPSRHRSMSLPPLTRPQVESWLDRLLDRGNNIVAFDGDDLIGHVAYSPQDAAESELVVFIAEEYQNRGLGTELCRQAVAHAAADGQDAMRLHVDTANESAIHVYESLGFQTVEADSDDGELLMRLDLTDDVSERMQAPPAERFADAD